MDSEYRKVLEAALRLSPEDQAKLVDELVLGPNDEDPAEVEKAWAEEIQRRAEEIDSGKATMLSRDEFNARMSKACQRD